MSIHREDRRSIHIGISLSFSIIIEMILLAEFLEALQKNLSHVVVEKRNRQKKKELWTEINEEKGPGIEQFSVHNHGSGSFRIRKNLKS